MKVSADNRHHHMMCVCVCVDARSLLVSLYFFISAFYQNTLYGCVVYLLHCVNVYCVCEHTHFSAV